jgi:tetratricopeptide (TPR) repeat protein
MMESLTRQPLSRAIASRKSSNGKSALLPVPEADLSPSGKTAGSVSHYSLSPTKSARSIHDDVENIPPDDASDPGHLVMSDQATDLRARMEAELIALRRAQSIFAESHPSVDVHAKLQDLQEMYIGDLLVKDCQISQLRSQLESLMAVAERSARSNISTPTMTSSVPPPHASMLAARVQSLQKAVSQERHRRMEVEHRLEELLKSNERSGVSDKAQLSRLTSSHRLEVHQLKAKLAQLSEANKQLQNQMMERQRSSGEQSPAITNGGGGASPASSAVGGASAEKVSYVKYAQLRAEKRQIEAKLNAQIEEMKTEHSQAIIARDAELEKVREHNRRVVADLERKTRLAQQSKSEDGKELKELKPLYEKALSDLSHMEELNREYKRRIDLLEEDLKLRESELIEMTESEKFLSLELEEREKVIAQLELKGSKAGTLTAELEKLREERLDLLEKVEEREDMLKSVQDSVANLQAKLAERDKEVAAMVSQADELDSLLSRADQDVTSSRLKIQALTSELESLRSSAGASSGELKQRISSLESELTKKESTIQALTMDVSKAVSDRDQIGHRLQSVMDERDRLTSRIEEMMSQKSSPRKDAALVDAERKIGQLERELDSMRRAIEEKPNSENDDSPPPRSKKQLPNNDSPKQLPSPPVEEYFDHLGDLTENVAKAEALFHQAVDVCTDARFGDAVSLLEQAAKRLASLPKEEIDANDPDTLRILESDIYGQLGVAFQCLSQVPEAIQAYTTAVDVDPEAHACHANLAVLLQHQSRLKEAEDHATIAVQLAPDIEEYQQLLQQIHHSSSSAPSPHLLRHSTRW